MFSATMLLVLKVSQERLSSTILLLGADGASVILLKKDYNISVEDLKIVGREGQTLKGLSKDPSTQELTTLPSIGT